MTAIDLFAKVYDLPPAVRQRALSMGIPTVIPLTRGLAIRVENLDGDHAETSMPFSRRSKNHVGSVYIGALVIQAEITMATLVISQCRPPSFRVLVKKNACEFHARATSRVRAVCRPIGDERETLDRLRALSPGEKGEGWITVDSTNGDGTVLCTSRFLISVKRA